MNPRLSLPILVLVSCSEQRTPSQQDGAPREGAPKTSAPAIITIDGSSTVFPITEAVAEEFQKTNPGTRVTIGVSGTGGGMKKFCAGELAITGASRPIKASEQAACKAAGIDYIELPVAYDGIAVAVHKDATWIDHVTVPELASIWAPEAQDNVKRWNQVRPGWPDEEMHLYGPGVDSGTYDYFTQVIVGKEHSSRGDFTSSEDDNVLVQGVASDKGALGFFGLAYYAENKERLKLVPVDDGVPDNGAGPIAPSVETVSNGTYQPLSRPIFIYVTTEAANRPEVRDFVHYYLGPRGKALTEEVGYISLPDAEEKASLARFDGKVTGPSAGAPAPAAPTQPAVTAE